MKNYSNEDSYKMGATAWQHFLSLQDNPFLITSKSHRYWNQGFKDCLYLEKLVLKMQKERNLENPNSE